MEAIDGDGMDEWQVVTKKKGGKSKQKHAAVPEHSPIESPTKTEPRKEAILCGSPSMRSNRSGVSTKDTDTTVDDPVSLPDSPTMESVWSDSSTDVPAAPLDAEESCSLQTSSSGPTSPRLEVSPTLDTCQKAPASKASKRSSANVKSANTPAPANVKSATKAGTADKLAVPKQPHLSGTLSHAIQRAAQTDEVANAGKPRSATQKTQPQKNTVCKAGVPGQKECQATACKVGQKPLVQPGQKTLVPSGVSDSRDNVSIVGSSRISDPIKAQAVSERKSSKASRKHSQKHSALSPAKEVLEPLGSTWIHNGRRDEASAEWRLVEFQPLWSCPSPEIPHIPVSVKSVDGGMRLVIKQTFLSLEPTSDAPCHPRRAQSLDTLLRLEKGRTVARPRLQGKALAH